MVRIAGVNIPTNKRLVVALTSIKGIGLASARKICLDCEILEDVRPVKLSETEISILREKIEKNYLVEGDLRREKDRAIRRLISIKCRRGYRHQNRLPVRGQRSKTNASTRKKGIN